jgi:hypothetical protein
VLGSADAATQFQARTCFLAFTAEFERKHDPVTAGKGA